MANTNHTPCFYTFSRVGIIFDFVLRENMKLDKKGSGGELGEGKHDQIYYMKFSNNKYKDIMKIN